MTLFGIDNGCSGSIGVIRNGQALYFGPVPTADCLHYGKRGTISQRLDRGRLRCLLLDHLGDEDLRGAARVYLERPFTAGPRMMNAALSAARFFEATLGVLDDLGLGYEVIDSREWQPDVLGNVKGSPELKKASRLRGLQLYPHLKDAITRHGDADGLLIAHRFSRT